MGWVIPKVSHCDGAWGKLQMSGFRNKSTSRKKGTSDKITGMFRRTETVLGPNPGYHWKRPYKIVFETKVPLETMVQLGTIFETMNEPIRTLFWLANQKPTSFNKYERIIEQYVMMNHSNESSWWRHHQNVTVVHFY